MVKCTEVQFAFGIISSPLYSFVLIFNIVNTKSIVLH